MRRILIGAWLLTAAACAGPAKTGAGGTPKLDVAPPLERWVNPGVPVSGDGTREKPFKSLEEALQSVSGPAVLHLATGMYRGPFQFPPGLRIEGSTCHHVSHRSRLPCDQMGERCPIHEALASGRPSRAMHLHFTERGRDYHEVALHPLRDGSGKVTSYLEIITPITTVSAMPAEGVLVGAAKAFREAMQQRRIRRVNPRVAAFSFLGMVLWIYKWFRSDGALSPERLAREMRALFFDGLALEVNPGRS